ncbi:DUF4245 domain-containing protein [Streptomyces sp. TP-A0874]|uniref:DUF4245 domain-containing protein n=1 Tax=Streptomyces sp. TP-A0874 TaxID=549819 RepID=UPI00099F99B8|nr:DUF4245 domain-containing protein [Streptomyces sp. TP-A0874]
MRGKQAVRDMVLSMAVIGAVVAVVYMFIPHDDSPKASVKTVGYQVEMDTARRAAPYPIAAPPEGKPAGWQATSVTYRADGEHGASWHLGFLDPEQEYVAVEQSDGNPKKFIAKVSQRAEKTGESQRIAGERWQRYEGGQYNALVLEGDGVTTVVTGTASFTGLAEMAAALEMPEPDSP